MGGSVAMTKPTDVTAATPPVSSGVPDSVRRAQLEAEAQKWAGYPCAGDILEGWSGGTALVLWAKPPGATGAAYAVYKGGEGPLIANDLDWQVHRVWRTGRIVWEAF